jgi:hypothetical protein
VLVPCTRVIVLRYAMISVAAQADWGVKTDCSGVWESRGASDGHLP